MKRYIVAIFTVLLSIIGLTGCGHSNSHDNHVGPHHASLTSVRVSLTKNGQAVTSPDSIALYTSEALMKEGFGTSVNPSFRGSVGIAEGVYRPTTDCGNGEYMFTVPNGDYTLVAEKGSSKVVTAVRAAEAVEPLAVSLTPTGKISGTATANGAASNEGIFVYLKNTSFVAITDANGNFNLEGVPSGAQYTICSVLNTNGKVYTSKETSVTISGDSLAAKATLALADTTGNNGYTVTGKLTSSDSSVSLKNKVIMVTGGDPVNSLSVTKFVLTDDKGAFSLNLSSKGSYTAAVLGNELSYSPSVQQITIPEKLVFDAFNVTGQASYGHLKVTITDVTAEKSIISEPLDRYLVKLIGSGTTYYCTQTRASCIMNKQGNGSEIQESIAEFSNIPVGAYSVIVDPEGNGFFGSSTIFNVKAGLNENNVKVEYIKPYFNGSVEVQEVSVGNNVNYSYSLRLTDSNFSKDEVSIAVYKENTKKLLNINNAKNDGNDIVLPLSEKILSGENIVVFIDRPWSDFNVSGRSGLVRLAHIVEYENSSLLDFDINPICKLGYNQMGSEVLYNSGAWGSVVFTYGEGVLFVEGKKISSDGNINDITINQAPGDDRLLGVENNYYVKASVKDNNNFTYTVYSLENGTSKGQFDAENAIERVGTVHLTDGYLSINSYVNDQTSNMSTCTKLYDFQGNLVADFGTNRLYAESGNFAKKGDKTFICVLKESSLSSDYGGIMSKIFIYEVSNTLDQSKPNNEVEINCPFDGSIVERFLAIGNNSFIIEISRNGQYYSYLISGNSVQEIIGSRYFFCMDKNGYLYCYDHVLESMIKISSVNGKALAKIGFGELDLGGQFAGVIGVDQLNNLYWMYNNDSIYDVYSINTDSFVPCE